MIPQPARYLSRRFPSLLIARASHPRRQVGASAGVGREQIERGINADIPQRLAHARVIRAVQAPLHFVQIDLQRLAWPMKTMS